MTQRLSGFIFNPMGWLKSARQNWRCRFFLYTAFSWEVQGFWTFSTVFPALPLYNGMPLEAYKSTLCGCFMPAEQTLINIWLLLKSVIYRLEFSNHSFVHKLFTVTQTPRCNRVLSIEEVHSKPNALAHPMQMQVSYLFHVFGSCQQTLESYS